jgi:peroxiredoxin Q/BCP
MNLLLASLFFLLTVSLAFGGDYLQPGSKAPDFKLKDGEGKTHKLSDYKGKTVVIYFYPKNDTPGCTAQACNIRDNYQALLDRNITVLGISYDEQESHKEFAKKYDLPFPLLADVEKEVANMYGAKSTFTGIFVASRITYIIDGEGKILHLIKDVDTKNHTQQILDLLDSLQKS